MDPETRVHHKAQWFDGNYQDNPQYAVASDDAVEMVKEAIADEQNSAAPVLAELKRLRTQYLALAGLITFLNPETGTDRHKIWNKAMEHLARTDAVISAERERLGVTETKD